MAVVGFSGESTCLKSKSSGSLKIGTSQKEMQRERKVKEQQQKRTECKRTVEQYKKYIIFKMECRRGRKRENRWGGIWSNSD